MTEPSLEHRSEKVRQLIESYRTGRILIPEFQREYVWKRNQAPKLIDSLYRGYPVSSLLLWDSSGHVVQRRKAPRPARSGNVSWLIDGQQRVITLTRCLSGDEGIDVVFNPHDDVFKLANAATKKDPANWYRLAEIWEDDLYRSIRRSLDGVTGGDRVEAKFERLRRVLDYEIPIVKMIDHCFQDAVSAFQRINTLGQKLKKQDIESARVAARHSSFIADKVSPFLHKLRQQGFARMNVMHLFRACAFIAHPDGRKRTPLHELDSASVNKAWKQTEKAVDEALTLVRSELGLINMDILWSGSLLVPVIVLCAGSPRGRKASELAGWLALAALLHRYSSASESALDQDLRACRSTDPIRALLANLRQIRPTLTAQPSDFAGRLADRSALLAMYIACKQRGVLDFHTGAKVGLATTIDRHHIMPRGQFSTKARPRADCIANIAFITGSTNKSINVTGPEVYIPKVGKKIRVSQCIPENPELWRVDRAEQFWAARRELLADAFNEFTASALERRRKVANG
jgi:hypothetical protein